MEKIEEKAVQVYPYPQNVAAPIQRKAWINGYTTRNDEVVKMVEELDGSDGQSGEYYLGYFACKNDLLTKLKEDKK